MKMSRRVVFSPGHQEREGDGKISLRGEKVENVAQVFQKRSQHADGYSAAHERMNRGSAEEALLLPYHAGWRQHSVVGVKILVCS